VTRTRLARAERRTLYSIASTVRQGTVTP
jgi:hypothetical protein